MVTTLSLTERQLYDAFISLLKPCSMTVCLLSDQGALNKIHNLEASQQRLSSTADAAKQQVAPSF